jgi:ribosome-binding factor A
MDRVGELIRRELSIIIDRELGEQLAMVSVSGVEVSRDMKHAKVFVMVYGDNKTADETVAALNEQVPFIRKTLCGRVQIRYIPDLRFYFDSSTVDGMRIDRLLDKVREGQE